MRRSMATLAILVASLPMLPSSSTLAADGDGVPWLNSLGRYLGVGYSYHGYQAAQGGGLPVVRRNHPAANYRSGALLAPYHAAGLQPTAHPNSPAGRIEGVLAQPAHATGALQQPTSDSPRQPAPPAGPPPIWLEEYLDQQPSPAPPLEPTPTPSLESSPSDRDGAVAPTRPAGTQLTAHADSAATPINRYTLGRRVAR